jgi:hypothetical protein
MEILKLQGITFFICAFLNFIFAFLIWRGMRGNRVRFHFGLVALFSGLYALPYGILYFFHQSLSFELQLFLFRATWIGILILPAFVTFTFYFTEIKKTKIINIIFYSTGLTITLFSIFTPPRY